MDGDRMPVGVIRLDEPRGGLRPVHVAGEIQAILAVGMGLVFVGERPEKDVLERTVAGEQMAQPEALAPVSRGRYW